MGRVELAQHFPEQPLAAASIHFRPHRVIHLAGQRLIGAPSNSATRSSSSDTDILSFEMS
jgi:hypothetical protein